MAENTEFKHIVRVASTDLEGRKQTLLALTKIKGISFMLANAICHKAGVNRQAILGNIPDSDIKKLQAVIEDLSGSGIPSWMMNRRKDYETGVNMHLIVNDLLLAHDNDKKRLRKIRSYRGIRHASGLPLRGQRTKSNFRRNKGKKR